MPELDINEISKVLQQRYPFLMVDRITEYDDTHITGYKNVTINEAFFQGHFPGNPIMPGVMILESMGQVASVMVGLKLGKEGKNKIAFFAGADKVRFRKHVKPGDKLVTKVELLKARSNSGKAKVAAYVDDEVVAEGEFLFIVGEGAEQ
ncbi:MAG: 3-hydroxyacyl-ACP dehydratase FabZ [Synergistaceae bacterium]|nr:3-hydroxyacyl-ACP dehydratase FabZ [Synergistaceae bacterium]